MSGGKILALMAGLLGFSTGVVAQTIPPTDPIKRLGYLTAGELADRCHESATASITYCFSYIAAVRDTMRAYEIWLNQREFCETGRLSQGELRQAFLTYVTAYPTKRAGQAASVIVVALKDAYPCPTIIPPKP